MNQPPKRDFSALSRKAADLRTVGMSPSAPSAAEVPAAAPAQTPVERPQREPQPGSTGRKPGRPATGRASKGIGLPSELADGMISAAEATEQSYGDWLMAAFNDVYDRLADVYPPLPQYRPELPPPRRSPRRRVPGGRRAVNFRLTDDQIAAIDKRQAELAVESRSEFVSMIVQLRLEA